MPKHVLLFLLFLTLLILIFYHPVPDPDSWDADARHIAMPHYPLLEAELASEEAAQIIGTTP